MLFRLKVLFTTKCRLSGEVPGSLSERGMQWTYFQDAVIEDRSMMLTKGRENFSKAASVEGGVRDLV